jgi:hypothetical protein
LPVTIDLKTRKQSISIPSQALQKSKERLADDFASRVLPEPEFIPAEALSLLMESRQFPESGVASVEPRMARVGDDKKNQL